MKIPGPETFGPHRDKKDGRWYLGASPSKKAVARIKDKGGKPTNTQQHGDLGGGAEPAESDSEGWSAYFSYGTRTAAYGAVDNYVYESVRHFLRRRHQMPSRVVLEIPS